MRKGIDMAIQCRPMRCNDVAACVEVVAQHPYAGCRYADVRAELSAVWSSLLGREAFRAYVYEDLQESPPRLIGLGCSALISDEFLCETKTPPFFWIGPELTRRVSRGESPLLSDKKIRDKNARGAVALVVWEGITHVRDMTRIEVSNTFLRTFVELHRGFQLKEFVTQGSTPDALAAVLRSGCLFVSNVDGHYTDKIDKPPHELVWEPHLIGLTRELAQSRVGTWASSLFDYQAGRFGFRPSEQRLLVTALLGGTDDDIADQLGISLSAVKKAWQSIYERVSRGDPELVPTAILTEESVSERGKMKKQRLLAYLRDHPEELRPARDN
jgi:DNA-binding CsgD family transcriptional regulator